MADTIAIACSKCNKKMNAPAALKGKKIRCKGCGQSLVVAETAAEEDEWGVAKAYGVNTLDLSPRCPHCAMELTNETDVICLHCGYNTQTRIRQGQRVLEPQTFGDYFLHLLPGIISALFSLAFVGLGLCIGFDVQMPEWLKEWPSLKVYGCVFCAFIAWGTGYFAVRRLIMHPHPPEFTKKTEKAAD